MNLRFLNTALLPLLLVSCYFNSTARIYDKAEYEARVNTADLNTVSKPVVYQNGENYYIELPRYRYGVPIKMQHVLFEQEKAVACTEPRGMGMYLIPKDFAMYLTGQGPAVNEVSGVKEVPNADEIKLLSRPIPVVKQAGECVVNYTYKSPNGVWLRMVAPLNWLLVDVPVTVVENGAIIASCTGIVWLLQAGDKNGATTTTQLIMESLNEEEKEE